MGGSQSIEVPGGGTEGYHVLRVIIVFDWQFIILNKSAGTRSLTGI